MAMVFDGTTNMSVYCCSCALQPPLGGCPWLVGDDVREEGCAFRSALRRPAAEPARHWWQELCQHDVFVGGTLHLFVVWIVFACC